ncbi:hypothetical protein [Nocardia terpenica]|uniref:Uncharacterized protein n=1 Tax=Nocardia terpenica TaxID=455432 RepID=A0A6G9ZEW5_9NOCA|nr:hypothetical protein [Nocardia terpenica]QIS23646.1 hypothetical protein F6W96_40640 [Nocardia terpenica]
MSIDLENPARDLGNQLRTALLAAIKIAELLARRREIALRRAQIQSDRRYREVQRRIQAERGLAETRLRAVRSTMRTLAQVNPEQIAKAYQDAAAWRNHSTVAAEVAGSIETYMRALGIDPGQLRAAGRAWAAQVEPHGRVNVEPQVNDTDGAQARADTEDWRQRLRTELPELASASLAGLPPDRRESLVADLDVEDRRAAHQMYSRTQGLGADEDVSQEMLRRWRRGEAAQWAASRPAADLALFAALAAAQDEDQVQLSPTESVAPADALTDLWLAWRAREREGLAHPDLTRLSGLAFSAQLNRAQNWFTNRDPDFYRQWEQTRSADPRRSDQHLVHRYELDHARQWAAEIGDDLWKYGFARAVAADPDADLDEIGHRVWSAAGKPAPAFDPDVEVRPLTQRWDEQVQAAEQVRAQDPPVWRDWQAWRADPNVAPALRGAKDADLVADFHTAQAELWADAARERGQVPGQDMETPGQLFAAWRSHTGGQQIPVTTPEQGSVLARARNWLQRTDPWAHMSWQARMSTVPETEQRQAAAELIRDYEIRMARDAITAMEGKDMGVDSGTGARLSDQEVIDLWRRHTQLNREAQQQFQQQPAASAAGPTPRAQTAGPVPPNAARAPGSQAQQPTAADAAAEQVREAKEYFLAADPRIVRAYEQRLNDGAPADDLNLKLVQHYHDSADQDLLQRAQSLNLKDAVEGVVPVETINDPGWETGVEPTFRGRVAAGADPQQLADAVKKLSFGDAKNDIALTTWKLRNPTKGRRGDATSPSASAAGDSTSMHRPGRRRAWNSQERLDAFDALRQGADSSAWHARHVADQAFGASPHEAVADPGIGSQPTHTTMPGQGREQQQTQARNR